MTLVTIRRLAAGGRRQLPTTTYICITNRCDPKAEALAADAALSPGKGTPLTPMRPEDILL